MAELKVDSLDFDTIKSNLKAFFESQDTFKDYDFNGSGLSVLLDILAYNTHYQGYYAQQLANESFLDTAVLRNSVISNAKSLGYTPTSVTAPTAVIDVVFDAQPVRDIIPFGSEFSTTFDGVSYTFIADKDYSVNFDTNRGKYVASNVNIKEGSLRFFSYVADSSLTNQRFEIPTKSVDTSTLKVRVQKSKTDTTGFSDVWVKAENITNFTQESKAYYLQVGIDGNYEVYFGDNIISKGLDNGNVVILQYLTTSGPTANNAGKTDASASRTFSYASETPNTVEVVSAAAGGSLAEKIESIRFNATKLYQTQNRAVTAEDYAAIITQEYGDVESVFVWGGEENDPPEYGKVFVALKPKSGNELSVTEKQSIATKLVDGKNMVGIIPVVVDPDTTYLLISSVIKYDPNKTVKSPDKIKSQVSTTIKNYGDNTLEKFGRGFRYSKFIKEIDDTDVSILGNNTTIKIQKRLTPVLSSKATYTVKFNTTLHHPHDGHFSITSSDSFTYYDSATATNKTSFIDDDGNGTLRIYYLSGATRVYITENIGTINYATGEMQLVNFEPLEISSGNSYIKITVLPGEPAGATDIGSTRDQILTIDSTDPEAITVTMTIDELDKNYTNTGVSLASTQSQSTTTTQTTQVQTSISSGSYY